jgi:hypothetical protein
MKTKTVRNSKENQKAACIYTQVRALLILIFTLGFYTFVYSQNAACNCSTDITFLNEKLRKTPAFKKSKELYTKTYASISEQAKQVDSQFECYYLLNKLALAIEDRHLKIFGAKTKMSSAIMEDTLAVNIFKASVAYKLYPKVELNLDSLERKLVAVPLASRPGIYYFDDVIKLGVYSNSDLADFTMVVLDSKNPLWERGMVLARLVSYGDDFHRFIGGGLYSKRLITFNERIKEGMFLTYGFRKDTTAIDFSNSTKKEDTYGIKELSSALTYLKVGSFNSFYPKLAEAEKFYNILASELGTKELVLDLRNNGGGGDRNSNVLLKLLKDIDKDKQIHVLVNHNTGSNAEQFAAKLKAWENVTVYGDKTNGTITYEIKNSSYTLPCSGYIAELTSKKHTQFIKYESKGVPPDVFLDYDTDWLVQVKELIRPK